MTAERGWPAIDALRAEIASAEHRHNRRRHLIVLHQRHVALVADQIRYELAADRVRGRQQGPSAAAPAEGKPVSTSPTKTVASAGTSSPRPDNSQSIVPDPGRAPLERDDPRADVGYPARKMRA